MSNVTRYQPKELSGLRLKELDRVASGLGLHFTKNHNKRERVKRILAAYAEQDAAAAAPSKAVPDTPAMSPPLAEPKPGFERLCNSQPFSRPRDSKDSFTFEHGGDRPGVGRPVGMTAEVAFYDRMPQQPNPAIRDAWCSIFKGWALKAKCPEVALTEGEAFDLALPWTQVAYCTGVLDRIPPWLIVSVTTIWATTNLVTCKAKLAREAARRRSETEPKEQAA